MRRKNILQLLKNIAIMNNDYKKIVMKYMFELFFVILLVFFVLTLKCSGQVRFETECRQELIDQSRKVLYEQVGVREYGNNRGKHIKKYLNSVGLGEGYPYCAAGQYYCYKEAAERLNIGYNEIPYFRSGSCNAIWNGTNKTRTSFAPFVDDLIFWRSGRSGHVERIIEVGEAGWIVTIGFNTSSGSYGSQDDGQGVYIRKRSIYTFLGRMKVRGLLGVKGR